MHQPAVAHIDFRALDEPLARIRMPRLEPAYKQEIDHQVKIVGYGLVIDTQRARQACHVEKPAMEMGEHGPEAAQGFFGDPWSELWDVTLKIGLYEVPPPSNAYSERAR